MPAKPVRTTYKGRTIEVLAPSNPHGVPVFTVNDESPRPGERMTGEYGQSAADCLAMVRRLIDDRDALGAEGIKGCVEYAFWFAPGSWEVCPNGASSAYGRHIKPVDAPCNEDACKARAAREAARKARRAAGNPAVSALSAQLARAGFERTGDDGRMTAGFRVFKNEGGPVTGVRVVWYGEGARMPMDREAGRLPEIAEFIRGKGRYAVRYEGGATVYVSAKGAAG
ncbi:hypothetical protein SUDANB1_05638 [Streptomyces sp. enrichment culture]|uniref:hypothetical protein n=1 Tax=Streptomyces sp. enrichment culture TaxID=1795815 RepID=UPI003F5768AD